MVYKTAQSRILRSFRSTAKSLRLFGFYLRLDYDSFVTITDRYCELHNEIRVIFLVYNKLIDTFFFMHKCVTRDSEKIKLLMNNDLLTNFFLVKKMYNIRIFIVEKVFMDTIIS